MTKYIDHRMLSIAYLAAGGRLLLPDELDQALPSDYPYSTKELPGWDAELKIYNLAGRNVQGSYGMPVEELHRTILREAIKKAIFNFETPRNPSLEISAAEVEAAIVQLSGDPAAGPIIAREANLRTANEAYVNQTPIMTDANFDDEWRTHEQDRKEHPELFARLFPDGGILDKVGAAPSPTSGFRKVKHGTPMLSINDVFEGDGASQYAELRKFVDDMEKRLGDRAWPMLIEPKVDGMAIKLIYSNGLLKLAVTRGDGTFGDDVTDNVRVSGIAPQALTPDLGTRPHVPYTKLLDDHVEITGEAYMDLRDFARINAEREAEGLDLWKNPRNATSGAMKLHDTEELKTRPLAFVQHGGPDAGLSGILHVGHIEVNNWEALVTAVECKRRGDHRYATDGAVVKLANLEAREIVGMGTRAPNWACAFKFKPVEVQTPLEDIVVQVGRTGVLTPVAQLTPVLIDGSTVSKATLNNEDHINELGLRIGDVVVLQKAGAIIPEITSSETLRARQEYLCDFYRRRYPEDTPEGTMVHVRGTTREERPPFSLVDHLGGKCPSCGSTDLQKQVVQSGEGAKWKCMNSAACPAQLASRIQHFCSRGCLDIEGIGKEVSIALAERMKIRSNEGTLLLFDLPLDYFASLSWTTASGGAMTFGVSRAKRAMAALERAKTLPLHRWIRAMGIHTVGENTSKELSRTVLDTTMLRYESAPGRADGSKVDGFIYAIANGADKTTHPRCSGMAISSHLGPASCKALVAFCESETGQRALDTMREWHVRSDNYDPTPTASDAKPLHGKTFVITGTLSVGRDALKAEIEAKGGKVSGSVTSKTDYLVAGEGGGKKADEATKKNVPIIDEAALRAML